MGAHAGCLGGGAALGRGHSKATWAPTGLRPMARAGLLQLLLCALSLSEFPVLKPHRGPTRKVSAASGRLGPGPALPQAPPPAPPARAGALGPPADGCCSRPEPRTELRAQPAGPRGPCQRQTRLSGPRYRGWQGRAVPAGCRERAVTVTVKIGLLSHVARLGGHPATLPAPRRRPTISPAPPAPAASLWGQSRLTSRPVEALKTSETSEAARVEASHRPPRPRRRLPVGSEPAGRPEAREVLRSVSRACGGIPWATEQLAAQRPEASCPVSSRLAARPSAQHGSFRRV